MSILIGEFSSSLLIHWLSSSTNLWSGSIQRTNILSILRLTPLFPAPLTFHSCSTPYKFSVTLSGASAPFLIISAPKRLQRTTVTMSTATANGNDDDLRARNQQPVLGSQRAKAQAKSTPTEANRTGRVSGYFPLGYKEGFSQWVCVDCF